MQLFLGKIGSIPSKRVAVIAALRNHHHHHHHYYGKQQQNLCRNFASSSSSSFSNDNNELVKIDLEVETGIATMTLNRPPANSLSLEMLQAISESIKIAESDRKIQALIVTSSLSSIFCAGLDLTELYQPDPVRLPEFWKSFQQVYIDLYGSRLSTIAAMNGHAPAAGCMLALSCDYRIMASSSAGGKKSLSIGLNESKLGIVAPPWLGQQYIDTIGHRKAELALSLGTLFNPQEALDIGLVDEVVEVVAAAEGTGSGSGGGGDTVEDIAKQRAMEWVRIPSQARVAAKDLTRGRQIEQMIKDRDSDLDHFCSFVTHRKAQESLGVYLKQMAKRSK